MADKSVQDIPLGELQQNWGWLLALGIFLVFLGVIGLGMTAWMTIVTVVFFGVLLLIGGGSQIVQAFKAKGWKSIVPHVLIAILYVFAGIEIIANPVGASMILTLLLAFMIMTIGLLRIIMAFQFKGFKNWIWPLLGGIVTVLLAFMIIARWPYSGLWVIGLVVSIEMIMNGWSNIFIALEVKNAGKAGAPSAAAAKA